MSWRTAAGLLLLATAVGLWWQSLPAQPQPQPAPPGLDLRGLWIGQTAADDCQAFGAMCEALADTIEYDGSLEAPRLKSGAALDDLRAAACDFRMRGVSIGERQPRVRSAVKAFLDERLGTSGGVIDAEQRARWVTAYRELARACNVAR